MQLKEKVLLDIQNRWFGEHRAKVSVYQNDEGRTITVLDWRKPGTGVFSVRYILDGYYLHVTGDCGYALYHLTEKAELRKLAHYDMMYLHEKNVGIAENGIVYDPEEAVSAIQEYISGVEGDVEWSEDDKDIINDTIEEAQGAITSESWHQRLAVLDYRYNLDNVFSDWAEWLYDCGDCYSHQTVAFWLGLRMAYAQIVEQEKEKNHDQ